MLVRAHVFVNGMVQGVFFRAETRREAKKHNVGGWVRNLSDGRVEVVLEGEEKDVKILIQFCTHGPPGAQVTNVDVIWERYSGEFRDFEMCY
jgi:acylphosphatase